MSLTLSDLVTPSSAADILSLELTTAQNLGLPITSWQPLDPSRTIFQINGQVASFYSSTVALIAQGGYLSYAATMVDAYGNPITGWMDLVGQNQYNVTRVPPTSAAGPVSVTNATGTSYAYSPSSPLQFQNASTGATYTSTGTGTVSPSTSSTVQVQADQNWIGQPGTSGSGVVLVLLTPLAGVTVNALTASLVGSNAELNANYLTRCQSKLASLSPNGGKGAYVYVAESIPVFGSVLPTGATFLAPTSTQPYGVTTAVTRTTVALNTGSGIVTAYVANANGAVPGGAQIPISNVTWGSGTTTVTTSSPHGLSSGTAYAIISGVLGATGANNQIAIAPAWPVTITGLSSFTFAQATTPGAYSSGGSVEMSDLGMVDAAIQAQTVPDGMVALVVSASAAAVNVTATVYIPTIAGISTATATNAISAALSQYFASVPIGGVTAENPNIVPLSEIITTITNANAGTVSVTVASPASDVTLTASQVPTLGTLTLTVVYV